eukprot:497712-Pyramimonas_sp.AAC.1
MMSDVWSPSADEGRKRPLKSSGSCSRSLMLALSCPLLPCVAWAGPAEAGGWTHLSNAEFDS